MNKWIQKTEIHEWMTQGKTTIFWKVPRKGPARNNWRPITCLPMMWNILKAQIRKEINYSLISHGIFSDELKGFRKRTRGTKELLYIDQNVLNENKMRRKNLAMAWIDYKMAYDMVPQKWVLHCTRPNRTVYREDHGKLDSGIDSRR